MTIFEELDNVSLGRNDTSKLTEYVLSHSDEVSSLFSGMSVYAYAGILSFTCLQTLHEAVLKLNLDYEPWEITGTNNYRAIHYIAEANVIKSFKYLLDDVGVDINVVDSSGNTALHIICEMNRLDILPILLHFLPDLNIINVSGDTPLALCVNLNHYKIAERLLKYSPKIQYSYDGEEYDLQLLVNASPFIEIKQIFKKHFKSIRNKVKMMKYKKQQSKNKRESANLYNFYCSNLNDANDVRTVISLAKGYNIPINRSAYSGDYLLLKRDLCQEIAKILVREDLLAKIR
jgi:ankyrin repeat protein